MDGYLQVFEHGELKAHFPWSLPAEHNREHILAAIAIARDLESNGHPLQNKLLN